jgi:tetratricopeptide (TPR) repeat protein
LQGRIDDAVACYRAALGADPNDAESLLSLGNALRITGRAGEALSHLERAVALRPDLALAHNNLGTALCDLGRPEEARACFQRAVELEPARAMFLFNLATAEKDLGRMDAAIALYRRTVAADPGYADAHCSLGNALRDAGRVAEALEHLQRAVALEPDMALAHNNLGAALTDLARLDEARTRFQRAVELEPGRAMFLFNLATAEKDLGRVDEAITLYTRAIDIRPDYHQAFWNRGLARLSLGRFSEGWADYEHRTGCKECHNVLRLSEPRWGGSPLGDRRLLIHGEQGLGDVLQFIRFLPPVRDRAPNTVVAVYGALIPLLERSGFGPLVKIEEPLPPFDVQAPLLSLPHILGTRLDTIPAAVPYLAVEPARAQRWRAELEKHPGFKIGIAWQGRPSFRLDKLRSIPLEHFAPLAHVDGVRLVSLQKGPGSEQIAALADRFEVVDLGPELDADGAFLDTAAVIESLELVISSDTAVAHLAGGLGVRVWLALARVADWRWMLDRDDSPWYPTMRLFRQRRDGDWPEVFRRMADALRATA